MPIDHGVRGNWMLTYSGQRFYPNDPRPEEVHIEDIAQGLSNMCRFNGHVREFYSVAQHSVLCSRKAPHDLKLEALLHDASEAYVADIVRPAKETLPDYKIMEAKIELAVAAKFGTSFPMNPIVKQIDNRMLMTEASQLLGPNAEPWWLDRNNPYFCEPFDLHITPLSPKIAFSVFMMEFATITHDYTRLSSAA